MHEGLRGQVEYMHGVMHQRTYANNGELESALGRLMSGSSPGRLRRMNSEGKVQSGIGVAHPSYRLRHSSR